MTAAQRAEARAAPLGGGYGRAIAGTNRSLLPVLRHVDGWDVDMRGGGARGEWKEETGEWREREREMREMESGERRVERRVITRRESAADSPIAVSQILRFCQSAVSPTGDRIGERRVERGEESGQ